MIVLWVTSACANSALSVRNVVDICWGPDSSAALRSYLRQPSDVASDEFFSATYTFRHCLSTSAAAITSDPRVSATAGSDVSVSEAC